MQMAKTVAALARLGRAGVPHIALLADPCYGGVTASYATVADVVLAEPGALIGFAGPRVIEQITRQKLPERIPDRGVPARARHDRHDRAAGRTHRHLATLVRHYVRRMAAPGGGSDGDSPVAPRASGGRP